MEKLYSGLSQLFMTIFLHSFAMFMVVPAITDVTMSALCPGQDECSLAIYLTGFQQAITGVGTLIMMPLVGNLSDRYGRKALLTIPMVLSVIPLGILACSRTKNFFYAYYVVKTITAMICDGSIHCLAYAYLADNVPEARRASAFGMLSGIGSAAFVSGTLSTRFLSTASTFQVAASVAIVAAIYMRIFLQDSLVTPEESLQVPILSNRDKGKGAIDENKDLHNFQSWPSFQDMLCLLKTSTTLSQIAVVAFFNSLAEVGLHASLLYYLKAQFHFNKDQFADLMVINGIAGTISQLLIMPVLAPILGEGRLLSIGLLFTCAHMFLYSIAWSFWVPYVASMMSILYVISSPCMRSIVSKHAGSFEQGKTQGCISGICSFANVIAPLVFSPLTALFLSDGAPFPFPGFSIMSVAFVSMIAFIQSMMIRVTPPISNPKISNSNHVDA